jgi:hypothetical protein
VKTHLRSPGAPAGLVLLLASSVAPAQTLFVDGNSGCPLFLHFGNRDCVSSPFGFNVGPFTRVGEGARLNSKDGLPRPLSSGGTLIIRGGTYPEPILLSKPMEIRAEGTVTIGPPGRLAPFDLVADTVDANGLPFNPKWGAQRRNPSELPDPATCPDGPGRLPCTNQFTYENNRHLTTLCRPFFPRYHVNWFGATYEGQACWDHHEEDDDDYNINLEQRDRAGYSTVSRFLHGEFKFGETVEHFDTAWWSGFRRTVQEEDNDGPARQLIDGSFAIMTGLVGLDCRHDCSTEIHPLWALTMNVQPSIDDDLWVLFVRNSGNEGACGPDQEFIEFPSNRYTVRLPWRDGATSVEVTGRSFHSFNTGHPGPSILLRPGQGVFVTFSLERPEDGSVWDGELHLKWVGANVIVPPRTHCRH